MTDDRRSFDGALQLVRVLRRLKQRLPPDADDDQPETLEDTLEDTLDDLVRRWSKVRAPELELEVRAHDPRWAPWFEREQHRLRAALAGDGVVDIQHIGSTAIAPMSGKNILDLAVAMRAPPGSGQQAASLVELGYEAYGPSPIHSEFTWWWRIDADRQRAFVVHLCDHRNPYFAYIVNFRDFLRALPEERSRYDALKRELAAVPGQSWLEYSVGKGVLAWRIIQRANRWAAARAAAR